MAFTLEYMPFSADETPVEKLFEFNGANYRFRLLWNEEGEFYTLLISTQSGDPLYALKLVYGYQLIQAVVSGLDLKAQLVAVDPADLVSRFPVRSRIEKDDLGQAVRLYVYRE
jgi:hypothetical protein